MQSAFTILIILQFLVIALHDWLEIPGLTHARQMRTVIGTRKLLIATLINAIFPGLAVLFAIRYRHLLIPPGVRTYWVIYCAITLGSAIAMWWVPYLFGASDRTRTMYRDMYANTIHILPARGDNPRPNLLHVAFHILFLATFCLTWLV